jgi:hypothetical protein
MNNLEIILPLLDFSDSDKFYFIQIFKRRKDNPEMSKDMCLLDNYAVYSEEQLLYYWPIITKRCDDENARAYIRLNRRSEKKVALQLLTRVATMIAAEQYNVKNAYWSVAGEHACESDKSWLIDIDWKDFEGRKALLGVIHHKIKELQEETGRKSRMDVIPTKNGYHLITRPFNIQSLAQFFADNGVKIDYHKDNPTILYMPS